MLNVNNSADIYALTWPASRLGESLEILARKARFLSSSADIPGVPDYLDIGDDELLEKWADSVVKPLSLEIEAVESPYSDIEQMIRRAGPAVLRMPGEAEPCFLILLNGGRNSVSVIAPDLSVKRIHPKPVRDALAYPLEAPLAEYVDDLLVQAGVSSERIEKTRKSLLQEQLATARISGCWLMRLSPSTNFWKQIHHARFQRFLLIIILTYIIAQIISLLEWWVIGRGVFGGRFESAWLWAWALLLFSGIPMGLLTGWAEYYLSVGVGALFKHRLLYGAMHLEPGEIRDQGAGQFLSRIMQSEGLDALVMESGFNAVFALIQVCMALWVLAKGTGMWYESFALICWLFISFLICWRYYLSNRQWSNTYREMTNDLVERMVGHRTRLAQEEPSHWHDDEDIILNRYLKLSEETDRIGLFLHAVIGRGWLIVGLAGIAYMFVTAPESKVSLAVSLGGIMLASQALDLFVGGIMSIVEAKRAWEQAAPLFKAAEKPKENLSAVAWTDLSKHTVETGHPLVSCRDIVFRYREHSRAVLDRCHLNIYKGDHLLLEGPSGGGKSTLSSLIGGLRIPESGLMLLHGFDRQTIGTDAWRKRIVSAPQFHENHVLTETFAFNLLMGRRWPAQPQDLEDAQTICRELGLGDLLNRMPAGFQQMVGESGWQLSHGERSRLYIARALLQQADIVILDESFAALDPENLRLALHCVLKRADTLLVIAHP
jgi:ATP-binding cassette subfamily B protein